MMKRSPLPVAAVLLGLVITRAQAQPATPLTLGDAVERAMTVSQRIAEAVARGEGAEAATQLRLAAKQPTVTVSAGYTRTNHVDEFGVIQPPGLVRIIYPDVPDNYFARTALQWPIYTSGRSDALVRAAAAEARAVAADLEVARADLRLEVIRAYWAVVTATATERVLEQALGRADAHLGDVRSRFQNGLIPPNEVSSVEAQRARQQLQLLEARNLRSSAVEDLRRLTGLGGEIVLTEALHAPQELTAAAAPVPPTAPVTAAHAARAELRAIAERVAASEGRVEAIAAGRKPTIAVNAAADYANPNPRIFPRSETWRPSWEAGVALNWTLWDGGRVAAETAEATAATRALRARQAELTTVIATEIRQRQLDLDSALASLDAADVGVGSATEARRIVEQRFTVGVATNTEVIDAQVALLQAELDRTRALASIKWAEARFERALGVH